MTLLPKDPNSIEPYHIIWCDPKGINTGAADDNGILQGATISTVAWTVPSGITEVSHNQDATSIHGVSYAANTICTIWLSGGTDGSDYELNCRIVTSDNRTLDKTITISVRARPVNILSREEAATVLRCAQDDADMINLLPLVDRYIEQATGRDWSQDTLIRPEAKSAARMLLVRWHEDPGGMAAGDTLGPGIRAVLTQLEALALRYRIFEGNSSAGYIYLPGVHEGDTVSSVVGIQGLTGDQSANFETVISEDNYLYQSSGSNLDEKFFRALIIPLGAQ